MASRSYFMKAKQDPLDRFMQQQLQRIRRQLSSVTRRKRAARDEHFAKVLIEVEDEEIKGLLDSRNKRNQVKQED